jgi:formylglycine-generating enzyme required for sulfatase activity
MTHKRTSTGEARTALSMALFVSMVLVTNAQMRGVPAGTFVMGTSSEKANESPEHRIEVSPFSIDLREVSKGQYDSCVQAGRCTPAHDHDNTCVAWNGTVFIRVQIPSQKTSPELPVVCVTWYQARDYCSYKGKRLPTEAEWEYAALAGGNAAYSWGNERPDASRCVQSTEGKPKRPGSFAPNSWGLYDMTGNVWEWVNDRYQQDYYMSSETRDPAGPDVGQYRAIRGGGWYSGPAQLRIKNRHWFEPNFGEVSIGFRCAK